MRGDSRSRFLLLAFAQKTSALINAELDKQFVLDVAEKTPLQQVLKSITDKTGVPINVDSEVWDLLPYGEQTTLKVKIENQTLRGDCRRLRGTWV